MMLLYLVSLVRWVLMNIISGRWQRLYNFSTQKTDSDFKKKKNFINYRSYWSLAII